MSGCSVLMADVVLWFMASSAVPHLLKLMLVIATRNSNQCLNVSIYFNISWLSADTNASWKQARKETSIFTDRAASE